MLNPNPSVSVVASVGSVREYPVDFSKFSPVNFIAYPQTGLACLQMVEDLEENNVSGSFPIEASCAVVGSRIAVSFLATDFSGGGDDSFLDYYELVELIKTRKQFALPSLEEAVGLCDLLHDKLGNRTVVFPLSNPLVVPGHSNSRNHTFILVRRAAPGRKIYCAGEFRRSITSRMLLAPVDFLWGADTLVVVMKKGETV